MTHANTSAAVGQVRSGARSGPFPDGDLILLNLWVAITAFGVAACMAVMQALSRASLEVPYRSPRMYYMSVTAHGILMALVFTTFFITGVGRCRRRQGDRRPALADAGTHLHTRSPFSARS